MRTVSVGLRGWIVPLLCALMLVEGVGYAAQPAQGMSARQGVEARGVGKEVKLKPLRGPEVRGRITAIRADDVELQPKTGPPVTMRYADVGSVRGPGMPKGLKITLWVVGGMIVVGIIARAADPKLN